MKPIPFNDEQLCIDVISDRTIRSDLSKNGNFNHKSFVVANDLKTIDCETTTIDSSTLLETNLLKIKIDNNVQIFDKKGRLIHSDVDGKGYLKNGTNIYSYKNMLDIKGFFGFGVRRGRLNKKGKFLINWNTDEPNHFFETDPLYQCHPFFIAVSENFSYGIFFDNTFRSYFDLGRENKDYYYFISEGGELLYYFIFGPSPKEVINEYTEIVGRQSLPPLWALGFHQSRWSYKSEKEVLKIANEFRKRSIPCDAIYLDIDYMDKFKIFTINEKRFKNFKTMNEKLKERGFKIVTIVDPGVKVENGYYIYEEGIRNEYFCLSFDGKPATGYVWPGKCVFPDFTREKVRNWWCEKQNFLLENGVSGIWNDMNEPAVLTKSDYSLMNFIFRTLNFKYPPALSKSDILIKKLKKIILKTLPEDVKHEDLLHKEVHNVYGYLMCRSSFEGLKRFKPSERPFLLTRSGFCGIQKYAAVWGGDNQSTWQHLFMSIMTMQNLSLSGVAFVGEDIGGFWKSLKSAELFLRWIALGIFYPLFRDHSAINTKRQEPWAFGRKNEKIITEFIRFRYRLIPYIYSLFYEASKSGIPIMRSLFLEFPDDKNAIEIEDQFMFGKYLLVAPVYKPGEKKRKVYLPEGKWYDFYDYQEYEGSRYIEVNATLNKIPLLVKSGALIPMWEPENFVKEKRKDILYVKTFPGTGEFIYYEDDGISFDYEKGIYNLVKLSINGKETSFEFLHRGYEDGVKTIVFELKGEKIPFDLK